MSPAADERKFIHDLANQIAVLMASVESMTDLVENAAPEVRDPMKVRIDRSMKSLEKIRTLLTERRTSLIGEIEPK